MSSFIQELRLDRTCHFYALTIDYAIDVRILSHSEKAQTMLDDVVTRVDNMA